jgi:hypothetical protein
LALSAVYQLPHTRARHALQADVVRVCGGQLGGPQARAMGCTASQNKGKGKSGAGTAPDNGVAGVAIPDHAKDAAQKNFGLTKHTVIKVRDAPAHWHCRVRLPCISAGS